MKQDPETALAQSLHIGQYALVVSQTKSAHPGIAKGLFVTFFILVGAASVAVGLLALIAWAWAGFGVEIVVLFVLSVALLGLGVVGYSRSLNGDRPRTLVLLCAVALASSWVGLAILD